MRRGTAIVIGLVVAVAIAAGVAWRASLDEPPAGRDDPQAFVRRLLWLELQPVTLQGCRLQRFGEPADGGYLLCANLLGAVEAGYSYGISGYDGWGCDVSTRLQVSVHQYDCFNPTRPVCAPPGRTTFHDECVGSSVATTDGRLFDTLEHQMAANGDGASRVVMKMDVEGAEWEAFLTAPDDVLTRVDQLVVEFHGTDERRFVMAVRRLKQYFHVANLHMNNHSCEPGRAPFPAWAYEVLFVSRRLVDALPGAPRATGGDPLDAPNTMAVPDCQVLPPS
jgi:hypothetical protein